MRFLTALGYHFEIDAGKTNKVGDTRRTTCACRKSNSHVQMMKSAEKWRRHNATNGKYGTRRRRVLVE